MSKDDKIKKVFSSKLSDFEISPPDNMWERIDQSLTAQGKVPARKIIFRRIAAISAGVAAILIAGFIFLNDRDESALQLSSDTPVGIHFPVIGKDKIISEVKDNQAMASEPLSTGKKSLYAYSFHTEAENNILDEEEAPAIDIPDDDAPAVEKTEDTTSKPDNRHDIDDIRNKMATYRQLGQDHPSSPYINVHARENGRGLSISVDGHAGFTRQQNSGISMPQLFLKNASMGHSDEGEFMDNAQSQAPNQQELIKMEHKQPISIGLKINKGLSRNLSLETGIVYSYLSSKIKPARPSDMITEGSQTFHYLGVPILVNYTFARLGRAEFYASGGGMIQKDISGKFEGDQEIRNLYEGSIRTVVKDEISQDHLQLSLMANIGASYPVYNKLNVYATIGGAYYFNANNEYRTIYSDKRLQLDINAGLKIKF